MRKGFGLWQAIMIILLISGLMIVVLKYATISAKHIQNSFVREQSELFLNSAIEQTLLKIAFHDRTNGFLEEYTIPSVKGRGITYNGHVNITKYYLQAGSQDYNDCENNKVNVECVAIAEGVAQSDGMAMFEVEVNATKPDGTVVCKILRRTLQQP